MDLRLATLKAISFYLPQNVSTLNQCRKLSCVTVVCKHFSSYQGYPNYRWDFTLSLLMSYTCGAPCKARYFNVVYIYMDLGLATLKADSICCKMFQNWNNAERFPVSQSQAREKKMNILKKMNHLTAIKYLITIHHKKKNTNKIFLLNYKIGLSDFG
jgi:hypothetical protein